MESFFRPNVRVGSRGPLKNNNNKAAARAELPCASSSPSLSRPAPSHRQPKTSSLMHLSLPAGGVDPQTAKWRRAPEGRDAPAPGLPRAAGVGRVRAARRPSRPPPTGSRGALGGRGRRRRGARSSAPTRQVAGVRSGGPGSGRSGAGRAATSGSRGSGSRPSFRLSRLPLRGGSLSQLYLS